MGVHEKQLAVQEREVERCAKKQHLSSKWTGSNDRASSRTQTAAAHQCRCKRPLQLLVQVGMVGVTCVQSCNYEQAERTSIENCSPTMMSKSEFNLVTVTGEQASWDSRGCRLEDFRCCIWTHRHRRRHLPYLCYLFELSIRIRSCAGWVTDGTGNVSL